MAGEMSQAEVTREAYPQHFAAADHIGGSVHAFDQYQGPYVKGPNGSKYWLCSDGDGAACYWYDERREFKSVPFWHSHDGIPEFQDLLGRGSGETREYNVCFTAMVPINVTLTVTADCLSAAEAAAFAELESNLNPEGIDFDNARVEKLQEWSTAWVEVAE